MNEFSQTVTLADGTILKGYAALNEIADELWVYLEAGITILEACTIFADPDKTQNINTEIAEDYVLEFDGYTVLNLIRQDAGKINIRLKKGA